MREKSRDKGRLEDILKSIGYVRQYAENVTFEQFVNDTMRYFAIMKNVEIIGEAANMLTRNFRQTHTELPWRQIVSMRNVLVHGYANISDIQLWQTVTEDLPPLEHVIRSYIDETDWNEWAKGENNYSEIDNAVYKKSIETASNLKEMGLTNEQIAEATGLTIREIEEL
jgi:uncharacterized protein with HEPN domain